MYMLCSRVMAHHGMQEDDTVFGAAVKKELTSALKGKAEGSALALADAARDAEAFRRCARISMRGRQRHCLPGRAGCLPVPPHILKSSDWRVKADLATDCINAFRLVSSLLHC